MYMHAQSLEIDFVTMTTAGVADSDILLETRLYLMHWEGI